MKNNKINLGQYYTPQNIVSEMLSLIKNNGFILEPCVGNGAFFKNLPNKKRTEKEI